LGIVNADDKHLSRFRIPLDEALRQVSFTYARHLSDYLANGVGHDLGHRIRWYPKEHLRTSGKRSFAHGSCGLTTAFTCRAGCKERDVSKNRNAGPVSATLR
jgi:hypothetical protein